MGPSWAPFLASIGLPPPIHAECKCQRNSTRPTATMYCKYWVEEHMRAMCLPLQMHYKSSPRPLYVAIFRDFSCKLLSDGFQDASWTQFSSKMTMFDPQLGAKNKKTKTATVCLASWTIRPPYLGATLGPTWRYLGGILGPNFGLLGPTWRQSKHISAYPWTASCI